MTDEDGLLASFVEESQQHLSSIESELIGLEQGGECVDAEVLNRIFRRIHSIKGTSGFFGLEKIGELSHIMENLFSLLRNGKISVTHELIDELLAGVDALWAMVDDVGASEEFDIHCEVDALQRFYHEGINSSVTTALPKEQGCQEKRGEITFEVSWEELCELKARGKFLYAVKLNPKRDILAKGKTLADFLQNIDSLGQVVGSSRDISRIADLDDNDLSIDFIFSTLLDPELVSLGLEIPDDYITIFDLESYPKDRMPVPTGEKKRASSADTTGARDKTTQKIQPEERPGSGVSLVNGMAELVGELVLGMNRLREISAPLIKQAPDLITAIEDVDRVTAAIQEKITRLSLQPVSVIFTRYHRFVRDLSRSLDKEISFEMHGEDVALDKSVVESLSDPLIHLFRNAVDHGIEPPDEREKKGKSRQGKIIMNVLRECDRVCLEIKDDGAGIDTQKVGRKAAEKGFITPEQLDSMSEKDLVNLITRPGFSTMEKVSLVSGRGVGLDIVVTNMKHLGGTLDIDSAPGVGTTIILILPLTPPIGS